MLARIEYVCNRCICSQELSKYAIAGRCYQRCRSACSMMARLQGGGVGSVTATS
jgi:hypothetical protein